MASLPQGYAPVATGWPRRTPQPPILQPLPLPPQGTAGRVIGAPVTKANAAPQPPLFAKPMVQIFHSIFGG
jgi:hypothetical protein